MENSYAKARKAIIVIGLLITVISVASAIINWIANVKFYRNQKRISKMINNGEVPLENNPIPNRKPATANHNHNHSRNPNPNTQDSPLTYIDGVPHINGRPVNFF